MVKTIGERGVKEGGKRIQNQDYVDHQSIIYKNAVEMNDFWRFWEFRAQE